ncbi:DUF943 family protein [Paenibacillus thalictri]|nr:DUF943 family protein [Paenibacillus thalictri]
MDKNARRIRIEQLKKKIKTENPNALYQECVDALGGSTRICSQDQSIRIVASLVLSFPFTKWGRIDWESINRRFVIKKIEEVYQIEEFNNDEEYLIIWDEMNLPVIESLFSRIIRNYEDVTAVGFNTWIVNREMNRIIEVHHEGEINVGIIN